MSFGSASMLTSRVTCSSTPPSMAPGASSPPMSSRVDDRVDGDVEVHAQEVDVHRVPAHRVALGVLEHGRAWPRRRAGARPRRRARPARGAARARRRRTAPRRRRRRRGRRAPGPGGAGGAWSASWRPRARRWRAWWTDWPWAATDGSGKALDDAAQASSPRRRSKTSAAASWKPVGRSAAASVAAISRISATHRQPFSSAWRAPPAPSARAATGSSAPTRARGRPRRRAPAPPRAW